MKFCGIIFIFVLLTACAHQNKMDRDVFSPKGDVAVPLTKQHWQTEYTGGGRVEFNSGGSGDLLLEPQAATAKDQTFSALVLLKYSLINPLKDYVIKIDVTTEKQLRQNGANDWEVFWFFGNYRPMMPDAKEANYFILKPKTGAEFGKAFEQVGQQFLATDDKTMLNLGERKSFIYYKRGRHFRVYQNEKVIFDYEEQNPIEGIYDFPGAIGLYAEDSRVRVHSFSYREL